MKDFRGLSETEKRKLNIIDHKFERLLVVENLSPQGGTVKCLCECGNFSITTRAKLIKGHTRSCGCLQKESAQISKNKKYFGPAHFVQAWKNMMNRVKHKNWCEIDENWLDYEKFKKDMLTAEYYAHVEHHGEHYTTLDRIDGTQGYSYENCRWATQLVQNNNLKTNKIIEYDGMKKTYFEWKLYFKSDLDIQLIKKRVRRNKWDIKKACTDPVNVKYRKNEAIL